MNLKINISGVFQHQQLRFKEDWVSISQSHCSGVSVYGETFIFIIFKRDFHLLQSALI